MARTTIVDVRTVFAAYCDTLTSMGYDASGLQLQQGSQVNGRAYRIMTADQFAAPGTADRGYIGWTAAEAYQTIQTIRTTLSFVAELKTA